MVPESLQNRFETALSHITEGDLIAARRELNEILTASPDFVEARLTLGILVSKRDHAEARRHFRLALEQIGANPGVGSHALRAQALVNLVALAMEDGDWEELLAWEPLFGELHSALRNQGLLGRAASALFSAGHRAVGAKRYDAARSLYERAVLLEPEFAEAWHNLAILASQSGDAEGAERHARRALAADPKFADAHALLGSLAFAESPDDALAHFGKAVEYAPQNAEWWSRLGSLHARRRDFPKAQAHFAKAVELDDTRADAYLGLAIASRNVGESAKARDALRRAFALNPKLAAQIQEMMSA